MNWAELEGAAPELARLGRERLAEARVALLGTLRKDGSPRISPVEPFFAERHLLFGSMSRSAKTRDLLRDPRCVLHSAVSGPDSGEGELKLYGRAVRAEAEIRNSPVGAWWLGRPAEVAAVFAVEVDRAVFVSWDLERGRMIVRRWSPRRGPTEAARSYP